MNDVEFSKEFPARVQLLQLTIVGLAAGVVIFAAVAFFVLRVAADGPLLKDLGVPLTEILLVLAAVMVGARTLVVVAVVPNARKSVARGVFPQLGSIRYDTSRWTRADHMLSVYQMATILGGAMCEAAAMLAVLADLFEGRWISLAAAGVLLVVLTLHFPTQSSIRDWVQDQLRRMDEESAG